MQPSLPSSLPDIGPSGRYDDALGVLDKEPEIGASRKSDFMAALCTAARSTQLHVRAIEVTNVHTTPAVKLPWPPLLLAWRLPPTQSFGWAYVCPQAPQFFGYSHMNQATSRSEAAVVKTLAKIFVGI